MVEICGTPCFCVFAQHPSPRAWRRGGYAKYVEDLNTIRAVCERPDNPTSRLAEIRDQGKADAEENYNMLKEKYCAQAIKDAVSSRPSLLHRDPAIFRRVIETIDKLDVHEVARRGGPFVCVVRRLRFGAPALCAGGRHSAASISGTRLCSGGMFQRQQRTRTTEQRAGRRSICRALERKQTDRR